MTFLNPFFLLSLAFLAVPLFLAFWNRHRRNPESFGGFFILQRMLQTQLRRWRLSEILKLINRLILLACMGIIFADPQIMKTQYAGADNGFVILLDVGRSMQSLAKSARPAAREGFDLLVSHLKKIPEESRGVILFVSDRCDILQDDEGSVRKSADWLRDLDLNKIPFVNEPTTTAGFEECQARIHSIFGQKKILITFISPFPDTLDEAQLDRSGVVFSQIDMSKVDIPPLEIHETYSQDRVRIELRDSRPYSATLIRQSGREALGTVNQFVDLSPSGNSWLLLAMPNISDPWLSQKLIAIRQQKTHRLTLWAEKESPGFLSLYSALKNFPDLTVIRQVGDDLLNEPAVIYGRPPPGFSSMKRVWIFLDPQSNRPFNVRDQKIWTSQAKNTDGEKAFHISTQDGKILIKKYLLLDIDRIQSLESFEDGAPSLMADSDGRWISPFDLEDLTTDLTLEPTFIPYLYRKLDQFLSLRERADGLTSLQPLWLFPGASTPTKGVVEAMRWPGIYSADNQSRVVQPVDLPESFHRLSPAVRIEGGVEERPVSLRKLILNVLVFSLFFELLICLYGTFKFRRLRALGSFFCFLFLYSVPGSANELRPIGLGIMKGMDIDRKKALEQMTQEFGRLSNLEFALPRVTDVSDFWKYAVIVVSSSSPWGPFTREEREIIRDYCERGGYLIFDDPLAALDSTFYKSVTQELSRIFPGRPLTQVSKEDVLFRTYYLMTEVSGRKLAAPYLEGISFDRRWAIVFSFNDLLGALLRSSGGDYAYSVTPYGMSQRNLARRLFLNLMMYSATLDYKDDAIHLPHILKRRTK